ncbi:zinc ribbon domain-containing protein [Thermanaerosceptrum fracticalcis]|uniref:Zinc ribbon domain-containing protein n=1 Tax=Thermanaerosceptrum fracticalcis TaxID=1712410 RepID=A0A7G6DZU0_THEFR|nr:FmdB family zinc ribbon protein [Thermanaerosceptrum fracticalcis]QNB45344.1 zinc ribbon domain-containing protein [Thermanaerosceptrum fracticalcis]
MPSYDYRCPRCGKFTITQGIKEAPLQKCPTCQSPVNRLIGKNVNIIYKCSGFYTTDSKSSPSSQGSNNETKAVNE